MLQYNLTGEHFPLLLKKPFEEALLKSVQAPKTMFVVYIEVFVYHYYNLVSIRPPGLLIFYIIFCIILNV